MSCTLDNEELARIAVGGVVDTYKFVYEPVLVVDASAPVAVHVAKRLGLANAGIPVAFDVLDEQIDALENLLVLHLPACIFVPCAGRECEIHGDLPSYTSINSWRWPSPRSIDSIDSRRTRWFASDQNGSGSSDMTSNGSRRRITDWRRKRRTALVRSRPVLVKRASASRRKLESIRICSVDVAIFISFDVFSRRIVSHLHCDCNGNHVKYS